MGTMSVNMVRIDKRHPIKIRPETRAKLDAITAERRWTFAECVDAIADDFISRHGVRMPGRGHNGQRAVGPDAPHTRPSVDLKVATPRKRRKAPAA